MSALEGAEPAEGEVIDPFPPTGMATGPWRAGLWMIGLLATWLLLTAGLCYLT